MYFLNNLLKRRILEKNKRNMTLNEGEQVINNCKSCFSVSEKKKKEGRKNLNTRKNSFE